MIYQLVIPIIVCFLPVLVGLFIFKKFDLKFSSLFKALLLGLLAILPISLLQYFLPDLSFMNTNSVLYSLIKSIVVIGLIEEAFKALLIYPLPKKSCTALQFLMLSFMFGLSLGCFESVVYYLDHLQRAASKGGVLLYYTIFLRIFSSDIIHMTCAGLCGLFVYSIFKKEKRISYFVYAVILHGIYDFFAAFQNNLRWFALPVIILACLECRIKYQSLQNEEENT
mgnify:CR=1 FL=1